MSDNIDLMLNVAMKIKQGNLDKDFVYCLEEDKFYIYMDGYWKIVNKMQIMRDALNYFDGHLIENDKYTININKFTISKRNQLIENLAQIVFENLENFNKTGYLNFDLGEFDPITGIMHDHKKENYSTLRFNYPYHHSAECGLWLKTLGEIFENDQDKIDILQEFFGYCLTRDTKQRKALLLIGESNCGKSTILWTLRNMLGDDNCASVSIQNINNPQCTVNLMNKLVCIDTDVSQDARSYEEQFKKVAGGEPVECNPKYIAPFSFKPYSRIVMGSNGFPRVTDHSEAFFNRLIIIPCDRIFDENEQNKDLPEQLKKELSGIFNWSYEGLMRLNNRGCFELRDFMKQAKQDLRDESNPIDVFFRETIEIDKSGKEKIIKQELYNKYCDWCRIGGNAPMSAIKFGKSIYQKYSKVTEKNSMIEGGVRVWRNIKYKETKPAEDQSNIQWQE